MSLVEYSRRSGVFLTHNPDKQHADSIVLRRYLESEVEHAYAWHDRQNYFIVVDGVFDQTIFDYWLHTIGYTYKLQITDGQAVIRCPNGKPFSVFDSTYSLDRCLCESAFDRVICEINNKYHYVVIGGNFQSKALDRWLESLGINTDRAIMTGFK